MSRQDLREMGGAYGTYRRKDKCITGFGGKTSRDHTEELGVDGMIILK